MRLLTFKGGIHPPYNKEYTNKVALAKAEAPKIVYIPLQQHIGAPAKPIVEKGDEVKKGQIIGQAGGFVSANVHSSVSGKVIDIKMHEVPGGMGQCIVIENDFKEELDESVKPHGELESLDPKEIIKIIQDAGIVGMGGATFPTHVKLSPPPDSNIDVIILNGAECEPYLTADHRLMVDPPSMTPRTGYGTPYWVDSKNNVADFTTGVTINKDMVFSCVYPPVAPKTQFTVTFENINGSTFTTTSVYDGDFANDPGIPTDMDTIKQDFVKWVYKSDNSKGLTDVSITDNSVIFVPVVQNKHKVEFKLNGSLINASTIYVSDGQYANYPGATPVSSDANKIFGGWVVEGTSDDISTKVITSDTVFEATFISKPTNDLYVISSIARKINDGEIDYDITIQNNGSDVVKIWSLSANVGFAFDQMQADWRLKIPNDKVCEFTTNNDLNNPSNCVFIPAGGTVTVTLYFKKYNDPKYTEDLSKYSLNPSDITVSKVQ